jgi:predicted transposase YbfD/YdcC
MAYRGRPKSRGDQPCEKIATATIEEHFGSMTDPRIERTKLHKLIDILAIAICALVCGCDNWEDIAAFAEAKQEWFATFLEIPNDIPSHDIFSRVFGRLNPDGFAVVFMAWISAESQLIGGKVIALDGKVLRRSHDRGIGKGTIDMVSAWACENRLVLGQVKVDEKSNEITAIPKLLKALEISGRIVTIDAMGCQTEIAKRLLKKVEIMSWRSRITRATCLKTYKNSLLTWKATTIRRMFTITRKPSPRGMFGSRFASAGKFQTHKLY